MTVRLGALTAVAGDPCPRSHTSVCNSYTKVSNALFLTSASSCVHRHALRYLSQTDVYKVRK